MNAPLPIITTHVGVTSEQDDHDLVFFRLAGLLQDVGGSLAGISRLCARSEIVDALGGLEGLHRGPGIDDADVVEEALALLGTLRDSLMSIPVDCEIVSVNPEAERALARDLDAMVRYVGARVDDNIRALDYLLR